jgi:alkyldihydroxyacetonephosphate synthase
MSLDEKIGKAFPRIACSASPPDQIAYARDLWPRHHLAVSEGRIAEHRPGAIVWPSCTEEVAALVRFCAEEGLPLVPFGAGSGVCGGILPDPRTVVMDLKKLGRYRKLCRETDSIEVEAGALGIRLEEDLNAQGFTLGHFPSSILCSTVGGWVAARSAGQCSGLYGKIEDMVASLECVTGDGSTARFERRIHGPDVTPLLIGSEGVLGVVTAATLRLHPAPPSRVFGTFAFRTIEEGWTAMREMFQEGLRPAVARLYDAFDSLIARMGSVRKASGKPKHARNEPSVSNMSADAPERTPGRGGQVLRTLLQHSGVMNRLADLVALPALGGTTLIVIFDGPADAGEAAMARTAEIAARHRARSVGEGPARRWLSHRYSVNYRQAPTFMAGTFTDTMEVAAPWSRLDGLYRAVRAALGRHVFVMAHLSHAYPDGCSIYFTLAGSAKTVAEMEAKYDAAWRAALDAAVDAGGTLSHHHGVGRSKAPKLGAELGLGVDIIHALRKVFDPHGILNPGNLLPRDPPARSAVPPPPPIPLLDRASLLVHASGRATLSEVERVLRAEGLTLGLGADAPPLETTTVDGWIAGGGMGAPDPWLDPADHAVAGFSARLASGADLTVRPSPRRAVGPDLFALFWGMQGRAGVVTSAHLRAHGPGRSQPLPASIERQPGLSRSEKEWIDRAVVAAASVR